MASSVPVAVEVASVRLVAVGDILMHQDVKRSAQASCDGLQSLWADVTPLLRGADIAFANLETPVAPATGRPGAPFQFNAPAALPAALKASGFTVLATANNHAYDQGVKGVAETLERLDAENFITVGTGLTRAQAEEPRFLDLKGLRVAFLGFTDVFNLDLNRKADRPWVRPLDLKAAADAVRAARAQADAVVVSIHWGTEYFHEPIARQRQAAATLAQAGADLILGHHPHVLQPVEVLENGPRKTVVAYSMGNFVSNQDRMYQADLFPVAGGDSRDGVAFQCRLVKLRMPDGSQRVGVEKVLCEPLWTENNWRECRAGRAQRREIRVIRVNEAIRTTLEALDRDRETPDRADRNRRVLERVEYLRTLLLRRQRAASILGPDFVAGGG
jgi:poly-gamma-glutamate synthesis protein (capsule biosynthesis protein)